MENKEIVLDELKEFYDDEYIFSVIAHFFDRVSYENPETEVGKAYSELSEDEELEVLEEYVRYRKNERANLWIRKDYKKY